MSKLFDLKEWLTLPEAAQHLTIVFGENVTEADVLRLALDRRLKISVNFVNHARARCGKIIPWEETDWHLFPDSYLFPDRKEIKIDSTLAAEDKYRSWPRKLESLYNEIPVDEHDNYFPMMLSLNIDNERFVTLSENVTVLQGVWDLPMIGAESIDIEHKYQMLTDGPIVTLEAMDGAFVEGSDGQIYQLQEDFEDNEYEAGSKAALGILNEHISKSFLWPGKASRLLKEYKKKRKVFLEKRRTKKSSNYYPAGCLPEDSVIVVRTQALRDFEQLVSSSDSSKNPDKPLTLRAETTYLNIIGGLLALMIGKSPAGKPQSVFDNQTAIKSALLAHHGGKQGISQRTLDDKFAEANRSLENDH